MFTHKDQSQSWPVKTFNEAATPPLKITYGIRFLEIPAKAILAIKSSCYTREQSAKLGLGRLDHSVDSINSVGSIKEWRDGKSSMGRGGAKRLLWKRRSNDPHLQPVEESWVRELRPWLNFWELIPRQMYKDIHLPLGQDEKLLMVCNMDFTVENKDGVKHSFDFREISIFGSSDIYESMQPSQIPVFVSEPKLGEIIKISGFAKIFENIRKTDLWRSYLFCEAFQISPLPLEFIEEDIPSLLASKYGEHFLIELLSEPQRECRFVVAEKREEGKESKGLHGNVSYVKFLSKNFKLEFPVLQAEISQQPLVPHGYRPGVAQRVPVQALHIHNPHPVPLHLWVPDTSPAATSSATSTSSYPHSVHYWPIEAAKVNGVTPVADFIKEAEFQWDPVFLVERLVKKKEDGRGKRKEHGFFIKLPPHQTVSLRIWVNIPRLYCSKEISHSMGSYVKREQGMWVWASDLTVQRRAVQGEEVLGRSLVVFPKQWMGTPIMNYKMMKGMEFRRRYGTPVVHGYRVSSMEGVKVYPPVEFPHDTKRTPLRCIENG